MRLKLKFLKISLTHKVSNRVEILKDSSTARFREIWISIGYPIQQQAFQYGTITIIKSYRFVQVDGLWDENVHLK